MAKSPDAFRTISEVADWLETPAHVLRFWESKFTQVKPVKRAGGRRYYRPDDMALLGGIKTLLHEQGMTIKGAQKLLREKGLRHVMALSPPLEADDAEADPVRMPPPRRAPARADVEDAEIVPDAPFAEASEEPEPEGRLLPFPGQEPEDSEDEGGLAIGPGFERALGKARQQVSEALDSGAPGAPPDALPAAESPPAPAAAPQPDARPDAAAAPDESGDEDAAPPDAAEDDRAGDPAPVAKPPRLPEDAGEAEPLPDLVDMVDAAVAGPPAAETRPAVTPERPAPRPGLLGALMRVERGELGPRRARLTGPAGRLAAVADRLSRERG